jgi:hypothetical protein
MQVISNNQFVMLSQMYRAWSLSSPCRGRSYEATTPTRARGSATPVSLLLVHLQGAPNRRFVALLSSKPFILTPLTANWPYTLDNIQHPTRPRWR